MAQVIYSKTSPYYGTTTFDVFLDVMTNREVPKNASDVLYNVDPVYAYRPDLLAHDLYGDSALWWVFAARNPNVIQDPIFDFHPGTIIYIPKKDALFSALGL